jgi:hypothetical protein
LLLLFKRIQDELVSEFIIDCREQINQDKAYQHHNQSEYQQAIDSTEHGRCIGKNLIRGIAGEKAYQVQEEKRQDDTAESGKRAFNIRPA